MQQQLSPKKYIQTRARTLPIYKCFVNKDWREGGMADVFVLRRHVTGNLTAGVYLVDLLCLGIKDTFFFFNEPEPDLMDRIPAHMFMEIDYALAHNIIYAGHDFALDFDIHPFKDFGITSFILEKDTDAIPLIEVHTGDASGKPHLIVASPGQFSEALAKLKKHSGEGGYQYTVGAAFENDDPGTGDFDDQKMRIDDFWDEDILPKDATYISDEDLTNDEKIMSRDPDEQLTLRLELMLRILRRLRPELFDVESGDELPEYRQHLLGGTAPTLNGAGPGDRALDEELDELFNTRISDELMPLLESGEEVYHEKVGELLKDFEGSVRAAARLFEILLVNRQIARYPEVTSRLQEYAARYPYARLMLALGALRYPDVVPGDYSAVYLSQDISVLFPEYPVFNAEELCLYWVIRLLLRVEAGDFPAAVRFYSLIAETEVFSLQLMEVQVKLLGLMDPIITEEVAQQGSGA